MREPRKPPAKPATPTLVIPPSDRAPDEDKVERLSFSVTKDGKMALDQVRPSTLEKIRKALDDPSVRAAILGTPKADAGNDGWHTVASQICYVTGALSALIVERLGYPAEQARTFLLDDKEITMIATPAAVGLKESFGSLDSSWQASLGLAVVAVFAPKVIALKKPATVVPFEQPKQDESQAS